MESRALKVALAGCGRIGKEVYVPLLATMGGISLAAVADADPAALATARTLGSQVVGYDDWRRLFEVPTLDATIIALPSSQHAEIALECLARGVAVYIEKPMATTKADAEAIVEAQRRAGVTAMIGFAYRANPVYQALRQRIRHAPGPIRLIQTFFATPRHYRDGWRASHDTGGGALLDLASHTFDLIRFLTGLEIYDVAATSDGGREGGERVAVSLTLTSGVPVTAAFATGGVDEDRIEVLGDGWVLSADRYRSLTPEWRGASVRGRLGAAVRGLAAVRHAPYMFRKLREPRQEPAFRIALGQFFAAVRERRDVSPGPEDGLASLAAVLAARESIETGRRVTLDRPAGLVRLDRPGGPDRPDEPVRPDRRVRPYAV